MTPSRVLQRKCGCEASSTSHGSCGDCARKRLQRRATGTERGGEVPGIVHDVLDSPGRALDLPTRAFFEGRFSAAPGSRPTRLAGGVPGALSISEPGDAGEREADHIAERVLRTPDPRGTRQGPGFDFSRVRIHTDERAAESARSVGALAYTVGEHVVFGAGQHQPGSSSGRRLLAHELAHVAQHGRGSAPSGALSRKATPEERKEVAVAHHKKQQQRVIDFLAAALKLPAQKDPLHADNLYRNTAELVRDKKVTLFVLTQTHDYDTRAPSYRKGEYAYFDGTVPHPQIGGDYPLEVTKFKGVVFADPSAAGQMKRPLTTPQFVPTVKGGGAPPPAPAPTWSPSDVFVFTTDQDLTESAFRHTLVHEGQHAADLHDLARQNPNLTASEHLLEVYKTEFRAHWIQPPPCTAPACPPALQAIHRLPDAADPPLNSQPVSQPAQCSICPAGSQTRQQVTGMKNRRQEIIFQYLLSNYPKNEFACFYVCDATFRKEVDQFASPASLNLVNSPRLLELNLAVEKLNTSMAPADVRKTGVGVAIERLDGVDWAFLRDMRKTARPFWDALKARAPATLYTVVESAARTGRLDQRALNEAVGVNPNPPYRPSQTTPP